MADASGSYGSDNETPPSGVDKLPFMTRAAAEFASIGQYGRNFRPVVPLHGGI